MRTIPLILDHMSIREVVIRWPAAEEALLRLGIDWEADDRLDVRSAALQIGRPVSSLLRELREAAATTEREEEVDFNPETATVAELTDWLERLVHPRIREELREVEHLLEAPSEAGCIDLRRSTLVVVLRTLRTRLAEHFRMEEGVLFPLARQRDLSRRGECPAPGPLPCEKDEPFRQMRQEHEEVTAALREIRDLTDEYRPPPDADQTQRELYDALARLEVTLSRHIRVENDCLWPVRARQPRQS